MTVASGAVSAAAVARSIAPWLGCCAALLGCWYATGGLVPEQRLVLTIYCGALAAWCLSRSEEWLVGAVATGALLAADLITVRDIARSANTDLVWLLVAAFLIALAFRRSEFFTFLTAFAFRHPMSVTSLACRVTIVVAATAFVIPSTSARAAMLLPVQRMLADAVGDDRIARAFSLLIPSIVLLSAGGVLTGAAAHLVALEIIETSNSARIGYGTWLMAALPIASASSIAAAWLIVGLFLDPARRQRIINARPVAQPSLGATRAAILALIAVTIVAWATRGWHGVSFATVGMSAAMGLLWLASRLQSLTFPDLARAIDWKLLVLLVSTVVLADALVSSKAADRIASAFVAGIPESVLASHAATYALVAAVSMLAHVVIPSRSARAAVLITSVAVPLSLIGHDLTSLVLLVVLGTGFCQLTPYGAKPLLIFASGADTATFRHDLIRLGLPLAPITWLILVGFALAVWPLVGISPHSGGNAFEG
jgi:di/tricarboxylate transporter